MKTCSRCGDPKPLTDFRKDKLRKDGVRNECKACHARNVGKYYQANRGRRLQAQSEYRAKNRKKLRTSERERLVNMSESEREVVRKRSRDWTRNHPERVVERVRKFKTSPKGRLAVKEYEGRRRALKMSGTLPEKVPVQVVQAIFKGYGNRCFYCNEDGKLTLDHFIALNVGGPHSEENLVPCCSRCNSSKQDSDPLEWMQRQGIEPRQPLVLAG